MLFRSFSFFLAFFWSVLIVDGYKLTSEGLEESGFRVGQHQRPLHYRLGFRVTQFGQRLKLVQQQQSLGGPLRFWVDGSGQYM